MSDECTHEDGITSVCDRDAVAWTFGDDFGVFDDGVVFSCQGGFIHFQIHRLRVSDLQESKKAGDQEDIDR